MNKLGWQYRKQLFAEHTRRYFLLKLYLLRDFIASISFGAFIFAFSFTLVTAVAGVAYARFSLGIDVPLLRILDPNFIQYWGQAGDFFGGVLNPLLSFMALMAVLYTVKLQRQEIKEAREETKISNRIQDKQTAIFERQNFEAVLFRLFEVHVRIAERAMVSSSGQGNLFASLTSQAISELSLLDASLALDDLASTSKGRYYLFRQKEVEKLSTAARYVLEVDNPEGLSHYFRNIYQILKVIDGYEVAVNDLGGSKDLRDNYFVCRQYSNMFRALLTGDELKLIALNCLTKSGEGLKKYVEKYSLLKHLEFTGCLENREVAMSVYNEMAFMDYEKVTDADIARFDFHSRALPKR